jgi:hypothetical protein
MVSNDSGPIGTLRIWILIMVITLGFGLNSALPASSLPENGAEENWNFKSTSIAPEYPTEDNFVTFTLVVNSDTNISEVEISICLDNICGLPIKMTKDKENTYTYKHNKKFGTGNVVSYKFNIFYDDKVGAESIPKSTSTPDTMEVLGELYFYFYIGENWNYKSTSVEPTEPTSEDLIKFTLEVSDDSDINNVMIEVGTLKPTYAPGMLNKMTKSSQNTFTYTNSAKFDSGAEIGYRFHIEYTDEHTESIPLDISTENVVKEQEELYFTLKIAGEAPDDQTDDDSKDEAKGFLPGFETAATITALALIIVARIGISSMKSHKRNR